MLSRGRCGLCQDRAKPAAYRVAESRHKPDLGYAFLTVECRFRIAPLQTETQALTNLLRARDLWFYGVRHRLLLNRGETRDVATEFLSQNGCIARINLRAIASARDRYIGHADIEQTLSAQLSVHMNLDPVCCLSLAGVAGHCIAMIQMRMLARVELDHAPTVHLQA